nr:MAG TPA: hypothetical protein [Caudoviricetes sp.]
MKAKFELNEGFYYIDQEQIKFGYVTDIKLDFNRVLYGCYGMSYMMEESDCFKTIKEAKQALLDEFKREYERKCKEVERMG